jgi:hypothetical protein
MIIATEYGDQKTLMPFGKSNYSIKASKCLLCFVMFGGSGVLFLCKTQTVIMMTYLDTTVVSVTPVGRS